MVHGRGGMGWVEQGHLPRPWQISRGPGHGMAIGRTIGNRATGDGVGGCRLKGLAAVVNAVMGEESGGRWVGRLERRSDRRIW